MHYLYNIINKFKLLLYLQISNSNQFGQLI